MLKTITISWLNGMLRRLLCLLDSPLFARLRQARFVLAPIRPANIHCNNCKNIRREDLNAGLQHCSLQVTDNRTMIVRQFCARHGMCIVGSPFNVHQVNILQGAQHSPGHRGLSVAAMPRAEISTIPCSGNQNEIPSPNRGFQDTLMSHPAFSIHSLIHRPLQPCH